MDFKEKANRLLSLTQDHSIEDILIELLQNKDQIRVFHSFEPNGRVTLAHALTYVNASKIVREIGGKYILFIANINASQNGYFQNYESPETKKAMKEKKAEDKGTKKDKKGLKLNFQERRVIQEDCINKSIDYFLNVLKALGAIGDHVIVIKSSDLSLDNYDLFYQMVSNSANISINDVKPPNSNNSILSSQLVAPCVSATEIQFLKVDIVLCSENHARNFDILSKIMPENEIPVIITMPKILNLKTQDLLPKNFYFFEDDDNAIQKKSSEAFCTDDLEDNPVYQYISQIFIPLNGKIQINDKEYTSVQDFSNDFAAMDKKNLKAILADLVIQAISPIREEFSIPKYQQLCSIIKTFNPAIQ